MLFRSKHLQGGVAKGAFDEAETEKRFNAWLEAKEAKIQEKANGLVKAKQDAKKAALEAEQKVNEARLAAKAQAEAAATESAEEAVEEANEEVSNEESAPAEENTEA